MQFQNRLAFSRLLTGNIPFTHAAGDHRMGIAYENMRAGTYQNHGSVLVKLWIIMCQC